MLESQTTPKRTCRFSDGREVKYLQRPRHAHAWDTAIAMQSTQPIGVQEGCSAESPAPVCKENGQF